MTTQMESKLNKIVMEPLVIEVKEEPELLIDATHDFDISTDADDKNDKDSNMNIYHSKLESTSEYDTDLDEREFLTESDTDSNTQLQDESLTKDDNLQQQQEHFNIFHVCPVCGEEFDTKKLWKRHIFSEHSLNKIENLNIISIHDKDNCQEYFKCGVCNKKLRERFVTGLNRHAFTHMPFKIKKCKICKLEWGNHRSSCNCATYRKHGEDTVRNPEFIPKASLNNQLGEYIHFCRLCRLSYTTSENLRLHCAEVHQQFECKICLAMFNEQIKLEHHINIKHNNASIGPLSCEFCHKTFIQVKFYRKHMKDFHSTVLRKTIPCQASKKIVKPRFREKLTICNTNADLEGVVVENRLERVVPLLENEIIDVPLLKTDRLALDNTSEKQIHSHTSTNNNNNKLTDKDDINANKSAKRKFVNLVESESDEEKIHKPHISENVRNKLRQFLLKKRNI